MTSPFHPSPVPAAATPPLLYPLSEFYARAGLPLPAAAQIDALDIPEPHRSLLVHQTDMTTTLERFDGDQIRIRVHGRRRLADDYFREVVLILENSGQPVEFGAICIHLLALPAGVRDAILEERLPLGRILNEGGVFYISQPVAFLRFASDKMIDDLLGLHGVQRLFGRRNTLLNAQSQPLAEIVEILPPGKANGS